ncbi:hypothetical protein FOZ63_027492 [Perkinsus olseni]|uniref:Mitochondrial inner membrane protease ATP23 n=1 Tax=Perkinsus olseni TaxID=32597 RepID=A0A7J6Q0N6_PEROL|nr:hypothetical protein FOZ63_027492 [Perkinsus olseni]
MWRPSYAPSYDSVSTSSVSGDIDIRMDQQRCDPNLSWFDRRKCEAFSKKAFGWWKVDILLNAFSAMNSPVDLVCVRCPSNVTHSAGFSPSKNTVWMCGNHFWNPFQFRRILAHELVHAFDFARAKIDTENVDHVACTEVRAANLSGECELWTKWTDYIGDDPLGNHMWSRKQRCVKDAALRSLTAHGGNEKEAKDSIERVWSRCSKDHWPFTTDPQFDTRYRDSPMIDRSDQKK